MNMKGVQSCQALSGTVAAAVMKLAMLTLSAVVTLVVAMAALTSWTDAMNVCALPCTASARFDAIGMLAQSSPPITVSVTLR